MTFSTQYVVRNPYRGLSPDRITLEQRLSDLGVLRESFTISDEIDGRSVLTFWEPDRTEALRILADFEPAPV
jgi:hypothetical protein